MRLFIGLYPHENVRREIAQMTQPLQQLGQLSLVPAANLHITLAFLGEVAYHRLGAIQQALHQVRHPGPLDLCWASSLGVFPGWQRPRTVWLGLGQGEAAVRALHSDLWGRLSPLGFTPDNRFHPHLTLARVKRPLAAADIRLLQELTLTPTEECIAQITLFQSQLRPTGAVYRILEQHQL